MYNFGSVYFLHQIFSRHLSVCPSGNDMRDMISQQHPRGFNFSQNFFFCTGRLIVLRLSGVAFICAIALGPDNQTNKKNAKRNAAMNQLRVAAGIVNVYR